MVGLLCHFQLAPIVHVTSLYGQVHGRLVDRPQLEPPVALVGIHFWLALSGIVIYVVALCWGGHVQGNAWVDGRPFMDSVREVSPFMVWLFVGGTLMTISHVIFFICLWKMRPGAFNALGAMAQKG